MNVEKMQKDQEQINERNILDIKIISICNLLKPLKQGTFQIV